ncbi:MAG: hypothetical protein N2747_10000 [Chitinophagaceae bacterium]|nr:hypothetical protein [Chitinophagaceae bacterium]
MKPQMLRSISGIFLLNFIIYTGCSLPSEKQTSFTIANEEFEGKGMTDIRGALEFEFNMLKNPATGKIPEGIRELELEQARQILNEQITMNGPTSSVYTFQGPENMGGRTRAVAYDVRFNGTTNQIILAGGVSGGVYKSTDNGATWVRKSPIADLHSVTAIVQDPRPGHQDTWYYGTGEWTGNSASASGAPYRGKGVYKSTDNGETWTFLPNSNTGVYESFDHPADYIMNLAVDPTNGNIYMAALNCIYRSTDGGNNWSLVLNGPTFGTNMPTDILITSTGRLYAAFSGMASGNMDGVYTSTTGNPGSWTKIAGTGSASTPSGWNAGSAYGRVVLAKAPSNENRIYVLYHNNFTNNCSPAGPEAELFYWDQSASTWTQISNLPDETGCLAGNDPFAVQGGYDMVIAVKPDDQNTIFLGGTNIYRSTDAGTTWTRIGGYNSSANYALYPNSHPDIHSIVFPPTSTTIMLCGNDGGIQRTTNNLASSVSWTQINVGFRTFQYYYVDIDPRTGNQKVIGGSQDNGTTRNIGGSGVNFEMVFGGDGVSVGLNDPALTGGTQREYVGSQQGNIYRRLATSSPGSATTITPSGESGSGLFVTLFKLDADNSEYLYYANDNVLYRTSSASTVTSTTWTQMTGIASSVGAANDITALALTRGNYNPSTSSLFIGTSNGRVYRLDDPINVSPSTTPVDLTPSGGFPGAVNAYVSSIAVNPRNDDTILITFSNYGVTSVFWTGNANSATPTWQNVEGNLTLPSFRSSAIHVVPNTNQVQYYVGTSVGLYRATGLPGGTITWTQEGPSVIGNAVVSSLAYRPSDANLLVGTHGYAMWRTTLNTTPLPADLLMFKGRLLTNNSALLEWKTAAEYNCWYFDMERSTNGIYFKVIGRVNAYGNSSAIRQYQFTDNQFYAETHFYRLKIVSTDGSVKYSEVVALKRSGSGQFMFVHHAAGSKELTVRFAQLPVSDGEFIVLSNSGQLVYRRNLRRGEPLFNIHLPHLAAGIYTLQCRIGNEKFSRQIFIK